jgi:titin
VYRGTAPDTGGVLAELEWTSFNDTDVTNGVAYFYSVSAMSPSGEGRRSPEVSATPEATAPAKRPPSAPWALRTIEGDGNVTIAWEVPLDDGGSPVTGYRIMRGAAPGEGRPLAEVRSTLVYTDAGLTNGVTYYYSVRAVNSVGEGPSPPEVPATPWAPPSAPTGLSAILVRGDVARCAWGPPASGGGFPITGYRVYRSASGPSGPFEEVGQTSMRSFIDQGVEQGKNYWYIVTAISTKGEGPASATVGLKVPASDEGPTTQIVFLLLALALIILIATIVAVFVLGRRGKGREDEGGSSEGGHPKARGR